MMKQFAVAVLFIALPTSVWAETYSFGVLPQRSAVLTAQYWNPILDYVSKKSGVTLELGTKKTSQEYSDAEAKGEFDFVYNNHIFAPSHTAAAYRVIARMAGQPIHSQIVVPEASPFHTLRELNGQSVGFPSKSAFAGYAAPMSVLIKKGITVIPVFGSNQEGVMAQLRAGEIQAAGVNSRVMKEYAVRENFKYRALWTSEDFLELPVATHPRVPMPIMKAVQDALIGMAGDAEGQKILSNSAAVIKQDQPWGFLPAQDVEYRNQRETYRIIWQKEAR